MSKTSSDNVSFLDRFAELERELASAGPEWLREFRGESSRRFDEIGLPHARQEEWRDTNLTALTRTSFGPAPAGAELPQSATLSEWAAAEHDGPRMVFIDGRFCSDRSDLGSIKGLWIGTLAEAIESKAAEVQEAIHARSATAGVAFESLNDSLFQDGAAVLVDPNADIDKPIRIDYLSGAGSEATASHPRTLIVAGKGSRVHVLESFLAVHPSVYFTNAVTTVLVDDNAFVDHVRVQQESPEAYHIGSSFSRTGRDARYRLHSFDLGGKLVRNHLTSQLNGEGGYTDLIGLNMPRHRQHVDNHTILDHVKPNCGSRELFKGILDDQARSVFSGRIVVHREAQKTDAKQSNPNLLLSRESLAQTRPQLEIYADDVKCTHGATVGEMDKDAIFYLRSRGIPEADARALLIRAFAGEVLQTLEHKGLHDWLEAEIDRRLARGGK